MKIDGIKVVIPARYGSSRLPGKPLLEINKKPIFWHVVQRVLEAGISIEHIIVATDDTRIVEMAKSLEIPVIMTSVNHTSGTDRINEVASKLDWGESELIINVQGDEPLIPPMLISELIKFTTVNPQFDISTAATAIKHYDDFISLNVVKAITAEDSRALYFTRSAAPLNREIPTDLTYAKRHVGIYLYRVSVLRQLCALPESSLEKIEKLEQLRAISNGLSIGVMSYNNDIPHGIDTEKDYLNARVLLEKQ